MKIIQFFKNPSEYIEKAREREIDSAQYDAVNVAEFDGELCLAVHGTPIFPIDKIGIPYERLQSVLRDGRETWKKYNLKMQ